MTPTVPIHQHPQPPHYVVFRGKPTLLLTLGEHYAAIIHRAFDYKTYLAALRENGFDLTRLFAHWRSDRSASHLGVSDDQYCAPWAWADEPHDAGRRKFDLSRWNPEYFARLREFLTKASENGVVMEVVLFCSQYRDESWRRQALFVRNNVNGIATVRIISADYARQAVKPIVNPEPWDVAARGYRATTSSTRGSISTDVFPPVACSHAVTKPVRLVHPMRSPNV